MLSFYCTNLYRHETRNHARHFHFSSSFWNLFLFLLDSFAYDTKASDWIGTADPLIYVSDKSPFFIFFAALRIFFLWLRMWRKLICCEANLWDCSYFFSKSCFNVPPLKAVRRGAEYGFLFLLATSGSFTCCRIFDLAFRFCRRPSDTVIFIRIRCGIKLVVNGADLSTANSVISKGS